MEFRSNEKSLNCRSELARYKESQWMSFDEFEKQLDDLEKDFQGRRPETNNENNNVENGSDDDEDHELYCVACNKSFKSEKA